MPAGRCSTIAELPPPVRDVLSNARRGVLATNGTDGTPHAVPVCYALRGTELVVEVDEKPKSGAKLARVKNIERDPAVALLADEWDEDWTRLAWVMVRGTARMEPPGTATDVLRRKYEQYLTVALDGPVIAIAPRVINWWSWT